MIRETTLIALRSAAAVVLPAGAVVVAWQAVPPH